jgi:effector-binding domain-containing protein
VTLTYEISVRALVDQYTAVVRREMPREELYGWLAEAFQAVHAYLERSGVDPTGPPFARFTFLGDTVAAEAGFPVPHEVAGEGSVEPSTLPDGHAAVATHMGSYGDLDKAYLAIHIWLDTRGYLPAGPHWEVYHTDPTTEVDPTRWCTDVVVPYRVLTGSAERR